MLLRYYEPRRNALATWRQVWIGVPRGEVIEFIARRDGPRILIEGGTSATLRLRRSFERIAATEFAWEGRTSTDGGGTWYLEQTINGER